LGERFVLLHVEVSGPLKRAERPTYDDSYLKGNLRPHTSKREFPRKYFLSVAGLPAFEQLFRLSIGILRKVYQTTREEPSPKQGLSHFPGAMIPGTLAPIVTEFLKRSFFAVSCNSTVFR